MTPIADMVAQMLASNDPPAAIVAAVRAMERNVTSRYVTLDVTLRGNRIRQQNWRNRQKEQKLAEAAKANDVADRNANVTLRSVTPPLSAPLTYLLTSSSGKPLKEARGRENARARGTRLAPGAPLSDEHRAIIIAEGIVNPESFWAEFVDYWSDIPGQRGCKISWSGTLRNRCRMVKTNFSGAKNGRRTVHDAAKDLHENLVARVLAFDEPAPSGLCERTGPDVIRLLPARGRE